MARTSARSNFSVIPARVSGAREESRISLEDGGEGPGFFARQPRARMTEQEIEQDRNCHYDLQRLNRLGEHGLGLTNRGSAIIGGNAAASAPKTHRVELLHYPVEPVVTPEQLTRNNKCRHAKDLVTVGLSKIRLEPRLGLRVLVAYVVPEGGCVGSDFFENRRERVRTLHLQFAPPESLEDPVRIRNESTLVRGAHPAVEGETRAEDLFRRIDDDSTLLRHPPRIEIKVIKLMPVSLRTDRNVVIH